MDPSRTRRAFLRDTSFLAAGALGGMAGGLLPAESRAIEPVRRNGGSKFKLSLAGYSYRQLLSGRSPKMTLEGFMTDCARMGLEGTELTAYYFPMPIKADYLRQLKRLAFLLGLEISGTAVGNDFCHPRGPKRDEQIAMVKRWIEHSELLGAPVIRIFSGNPKGGQTIEEAYRLAVEAIEECCEDAGKHGVLLALENHGGLTASVEGMLQLVRDVKSPWFGVNFDSGNFRSADPYAELAKIAPYSINVHLKVALSVGGKKQPSDYARLKRILTEAGYRGYLTLEYEEDEDPRGACPRHMEEIRKAFIG